MSRPKLKLPKKQVGADAGAIPQTAAPSSLSSDKQDTSLVRLQDASHLAAATAPLLISARNANVGNNPEEERLRLIAEGVLGPFRPVDVNRFYSYAKSLMLLTNEKLK